jgi:ATP-dependent Clp protease ATP-binding subunit ClpA
MTTLTGTPRWVGDFDRFIQLKPLIFLYGNILDFVPFLPPGNNSKIGSRLSLNLFLERYLELQGYKTIGFLDPFNGLTTSDKSGENATKKTTAFKSAGELVKAVASHLNSRESKSAIIFNFSSRLIKNPGNLDEKENELFTGLLALSIEAGKIYQHGAGYNNLMVFLCDKLNDIPAFMYLNNPCAQSIHIPRPDLGERKEFIRYNQQLFYGVNLDDKQNPLPLSESETDHFASHTDGMRYSDLIGLGLLSKQENEQIPLSCIKELIQKFKYGKKVSEWDAISRNVLMNAEVEIRKTVKGQPEALNRVLDVIKRARIGLAAGTDGISNRPRGVLFFAGPTGVGKTEMAKALAKVLFHDKERCIRFDMSEYQSPNSDQRLLGAPPGYLGFDEGGQLTRAVKERPFSVLLFDEIDKADKSIFDKFLQILDDGRLTDGKGETVYFSECVIIFTSNYGISGNNNADRANAEIPVFGKVKEQVLEAIKELFNKKIKRPEILNRFGDNFVVFDYIREKDAKQIVSMLVDQLKMSAKKLHNMNLKVDEDVYKTLVDRSLERSRIHGGRGIRNVVDEILVNPLCRALFDQNLTEKSKDGAGVTVTIKSIIHVPVPRDEEGKTEPQFKVELCIDS